MPSIILESTRRWPEASTMVSLWARASRADSTFQQRLHRVAGSRLRRTPEQVGPWRDEAQKLGWCAHDTLDYRAFAP